MVRIVDYTAVAWLVSLFVYSGGLKLSNYSHAPATVLNYRLFPPLVATWFGYALPWFEVTTAALLLFSVTRPAGGVAAAALGASFVTGAVSALRRHIDISCGCTGAVVDESLGRSTVLRGVLMIAAGAYVGQAGANLTAIDWRVCVSVAVAAAVPTLLISYRTRKLTALQRARHMRVKTSPADMVRLRQLLAAPPGPPSVDYLELTAH